MKKVLLALGGLIGIFVVVFGAIMGSTFGGMKPMTDGEELPGGARRVTSSYTSAYVIPAGEKEVVLVDCNDDIDAKAIKAELTRRGLGVEAVKTILLTHGHPDHTGGCKQFPGAQVIIGDGEQGLVDGTVGSQGPLPKMMGKQPQFAIQGARPVTDGTSIEVGTLHNIPAIVLELLEGETLEALLDRHQTVPVAICREVICPVLDALEYAHQIGLVHRDLKPGNVLLAAEKGIKNAEYMTIATRRGEIEARALVTRRIRPFTIDGKVIHQVGLPWHWGWQGNARGDVVNNLSPLVGELALA